MTCCFINYYISWYCIFLFTNSIVNVLYQYCNFFVKKLQYWNNFVYQYCQQYWYTSIVIAKYRRSPQSSNLQIIYICSQYIMYDKINLHLFLYCYPAKAVCPQSSYVRICSEWSDDILVSITNKQISASVPRFS